MSPPLTSKMSRMTMNVFWILVVCLHKNPSLVSLVVLVINPWLKCRRQDVQWPEMLRDYFFCHMPDQSL